MAPGYQKYIDKGILLTSILIESRILTCNSLFHRGTQVCRRLPSLNCLWHRFRGLNVNILENAPGFY